MAFLYPKPAQNRRNPPFFANFMVRAGRISQILPKSNQIGTNTQSHRFQALDHKKNKNFLLFNHQHSIPSPPNFYPNKYKHTNYMTMTIIQNQRERAKLFQTYICMPKRLRASKIILDIYLYDERAKRREPANYF